jgi:septal ring factor EnvC (AmiA/AmiB activator)
METVTLEFIAKQLERVLAEQAGMREDVRNMQADIAVLQHALLRVERDTERIKDMLSRLDARVGRLETERA